jgi:hypothetical protein
MGLCDLGVLRGERLFDQDLADGVNHDGTMTTMFLKSRESIHRLHRLHRAIVPSCHRAIVLFVLFVL